MNARYRRQCRVLFVEACAVAACVISARGSAQVAADTRLPASATNAQAMFARPVTVTLDHVSLSQAMDALGNCAGVRIVYRTSLMHGAPSPVSLHVVQVTLGAALEQILTGTQMQAVPLAENVLVITSLTERDPMVQGGIVGTVRDVKTKQHVVGATILLDGATRGVQTGNDGTFRFSAVDAGRHTLLVRRVGYSKVTRSALVTEGQVTTLDIDIVMSPNTLDQVVVTGTVIATELKAVPNAISIITAQQIQERGITHIDQLFRGDIPGLFAQNTGSLPNLGTGVILFSRGATAITGMSAGTANIGGFTFTNPMKTYIDGIEMADAHYINEIDPASIERIEILTGPQASTIYGSNAINGVMQIFTKRGHSVAPRLILNFNEGFAQNNFDNHLAPSHVAEAALSGIEGHWSYNVGASWRYTGPWTSYNKTHSVNENGGGRFEAGKFTVDVSGNHRTETNRAVQANPRAAEDDLNSTGVRLRTGTRPTVTGIIEGQTTGLTVGYRPLAWWSHQLVLGGDASKTASIRHQPLRTSLADTLKEILYARSLRSTQSYNTTMRLPMTSLAKLDLTVGGDHAHTAGTTEQLDGLELIGDGFAVARETRVAPTSNKGAFVQGQFGFQDALFVTYGVRVDWNPTVGEKARVAPGRYGVVYTREAGPLSVKLRGSYGRSIRPPSAGLKDGIQIDPAVTRLTDIFGLYNTRRSNPDLGPEFQQGGEGGIEVYAGHLGSLVITRYNQTVDNLISEINNVDSARSLVQAPSPTSSVCSSRFRDADNFCYRYQSEVLNAASIRNQGWELQGTANLGPFSTNGTYSWTKSRVLGVTPRYKTLLTSSDFQPGRTFQYLAEHTWAFGLTYTNAASTLSLNVTGIGQLYNNDNELSLLIDSRLSTDQPRTSLPSGYLAMGQGYTMADLNGSHRFNARMDATLQVHNLTNFYQNDYSASFATIGRQTNLGVRWRIN